MIAGKKVSNENDQIGRNDEENANQKKEIKSQESPQKNKERHDAKEG
jgi:hypothetical protein